MSSKSCNERVKASQEQVDYLMQYMRDNVRLSRPWREKVLSVEETHEKWEQLSLSLNNIEGAKKSLQQWQKTWRDIQNSKRKKGLFEDRDNSTSDEEMSMDNEHFDVVFQAAIKNIQDHNNMDYDVKLTTNEVRLTNTQKLFLLTFMKENPDVRRVGKHLSVPQTVEIDAKWAQLAKDLNTIGPPYKSIERWKQAWRDLRKNMNGKYKNERDRDGEDTADDSQDDNSIKKSDMKRIRINRSQLKILREQMRRYGSNLMRSLAKPNENAQLTRNRFASYWRQLAKKLDSHGPPTKSVRRWQQTWRDMKKRLLSQNKDSLKADHKYIVEGLVDDIEEDSKLEGGEEDSNLEGAEEERNFYGLEIPEEALNEEEPREELEFNPVFVDANPDNEHETQEKCKQNKESLQNLMEYERESLELKRRQIALEERKIALKEKRLSIEEAKLHAFQRIATALEQNDLRFNV